MLRNTIHVLSTNRTKHKLHHHLPHPEVEIPELFVFRTSMPYIFCHEDPDLQIENKNPSALALSCFQVFFANFLSASPPMPNRMSSCQGVNFESFCGQICSFLHYLLWDPDSVLPPISLWKAAFRIARGQDDNSHMTPFQIMLLSFVVLCSDQNNFALSLMFMAYSAPRLQASSRVI